MKKAVYFLFFILILVLSIVGYSFLKINQKHDYYNVIEIKQGEPLRTSLAQLEISKTSLFKIYLKYFREQGKKIKAGYYELKGSYSIPEIIDIMEKGIEKTYKLTIIEGSTVKNVIDKLVLERGINAEYFTHVLTEIDFPYLTPNNNFEGYFYPDTYFIPEYADEKQIITIILNNFLDKFPPSKYNDKEEFYQKLIMGSIIEREAGVEDEKPLMASVFYNRLKKDMKLQVDSTVNFVFNYEKKRILYKDLKVDSPYNTYVYKGMPPAPISNPTKSSVEAAFNPAETNYLFFVTKGGKRHHFTETYKEHIEFQKKPK